MYSVYNPNCNHSCPFFQNGVNVKPELSHPLLSKWNNTIIAGINYRSFGKVPLAGQYYVHDSSQDDGITNYHN